MARLSPVPPKVRSPDIRDDDDELDELPPIDDEQHERDDEDPGEELEGMVDDAVGSWLDDAPCELDVDTDLSLDPAEGGWLDDSDAAADLEIGPADLAFGREESGLLEEEDAWPESDEIDFGDEGGDLDPDHGGEDGPAAHDDDLREEDLPALDADDEGDGTETDVGWVPQGDEVQHRWDDRGWERAAVPLHVGRMRAVVCTPSGALAAGRAVVRAELTGCCELPEAVGIGGEEIVSVGVHGATIAAATEAGALVVSTDGGRTFRERTSVRAMPPVRRAVAEPAVVLGERDLFFIAPGRGLLRSADRGLTWSAPLAQVVCSLARDELGRPYALTLSEGAPLEVVQLDPANAWRAKVPAYPRLRPGKRRIPFTVRGRALAVGLAGVGVFRAVGDEPGTWLEGTGAVTALALIDEDGALLMALDEDDGERALLVRADPAGATRIVAQIDTAREDADHGARVHDLAWDDARGVLWVAAQCGLSVFRPRT